MLHRMALSETEENVFNYESNNRSGVDDRINILIKPISPK